MTFTVTVTIPWWALCGWLAVGVAVATVTCVHAWRRYPSTRPSWRRPRTWAPWPLTVVLWPFALLSEWQERRASRRASAALRRAREDCDPFDRYW